MRGIGVTSPPQLLNPLTTSHALLRLCLHYLAPTTHVMDGFLNCPPAAKNGCLLLIVRMKKPRSVSAFQVSRGVSVEAVWEVAGRRARGRGDG
jgi:hypothetical protein